MLRGSTLLLILFVAVTALYGLTSRGLADAGRYWELLIPLIALVTLVSGWGQAYANNNSRLWYLVKQVVLWGGLMLMLYMLDAHNVSGALGASSYAILLVYLIALTTAVGAVQMDSRLFFFAVFMVYTAYLLGVPDNNPMLAQLGETFGIADATSKPFTMTIGVAIAGFLASVIVGMFVRSSIASRRAAS